MRKTALALLLVIGLTVATFAFWKKAETRTKQAGEAQKSLSEAQVQLEKQQGEIKRLQKQKSEMVQMLHQAENKAVELASAAPTPPDIAAANPPTTSEDSSSTTNQQAGFGNYLAKMMENPDMKKMIREQQRAGLKMIYGDFFKQLNLNEDQRVKLMDLMVEGQMKNVERGAVLMQEGSEPPDQEAIGKAFTDQKKASDDSIKALIGEAQFQQYEEYNKNLGAKMAVNQFKAQLESSDNPLRDAQAKQLMLMMREESEAVSAQEGIGADGQAKAMQDWKNIMSDEGISKLFSRQEEINKRVLARAETVLTPDQVQVFSSFQTNQINLQRMSLQMARQMMGGKPKK